MGLYMWRATPGKLAAIASSSSGDDGQIGVRFYMAPYCGISRAPKPGFRRGGFEVRVYMLSQAYIRAQVQQGS